ncbi:FAD-dependent oxidoreductase [Virgibacillus kekensis]|uniref:FAD-dependent oxidoreductase n=1 Tax=Virgibacillus kekensis TaxID=202261 RepID=A0ABV9DGB0_9BACI
MVQDYSTPQFPESYWRDSVSFENFPKLEKSIKTDIAIVGGGITGITAAYLLAKSGKKVTLIDAGELSNGVTGHTTAKITAQHGVIYNELIEHFGEKKAALYFQSNQEAIQFIEQLIDDLDIKCDFEKQDAYIYTNNVKYIPQLETEKKAYDKLGIPGELTDSMPLNIPMKRALVMKDQAQFHPLKYLKVLLEEALKNGLEVYENTTATDIEHNKEPAILTREGHRISCNKVIQATHFPFHDFEGFYPARMYPERSYIIAVKAPEKFPDGMYINAESPTRSIRSAKMDGEELWLIGGENHKTGQGKPTIEHYEALQEYAEKQFGITDYLFRWSAQDLTTLDKVPYIGPATNDQRDVYVATGYHKWGMTTSTLAARIISDHILEQDNPYLDLYTPSRFQADPSIREFASINADVAKHMVKGKLEYTNHNVNDLEPDHATITRVKGKRTGVYKDKDGKLHALDTTCTHMGCEVNWNSGDRTWDCPCHGSRFSYTGEIVEGPAKRSLDKVDL